MTPGTGIPASRAIPWISASSRDSASDFGSNGSLTAHVPFDVISRHTCPNSPRATGPVSVARSPNAYRSAMNDADEASSTRAA